MKLGTEDKVLRFSCSGGRGNDRFGRCRWEGRRNRNRLGILGILLGVSLLRIFPFIWVVSEVIV